MKHNILYIGFLGAAMMLTSCSEDFLEVKSHTQEYADEYYKDADHISQSLVAAYSPLEWNDWNGVQYCPQNIMSDIMADDIWPGGASRTDNQFWHLMANYEAIPTNTMTGLWSNMYSGVKRCNDLLQYAETSRDNLTDEQYNSWTAQARVLRAYYYNLLWKFYGNIPYYTVNPTGDYHAPQLTADSVYANVITDLEGAINLNALPMYWDEDNLGRVSQAMAYMLYAEMVMYQNDQTRYSKALAYMKNIINDSHYGLVDDYASIWTSDGEWSKESIFEVNYTDDKSFRGWGTGDAIIAGGTVLPRVISVPGGIADLGVDDGWGFAPVRTSAYNMYVSNDTRRDASILDVRAYNCASTVTPRRCSTPPSCSSARVAARPRLRGILTRSTTEPDSSTTWSPRSTTSSTSAILSSLARANATGILSVRVRLLRCWCLPVRPMLMATRLNTAPTPGVRPVNTFLFLIRRLRPTRRSSRIAIINQARSVQIKRLQS